MKFNLFNKSHIESKDAQNQDDRQEQQAENPFTSDEYLRNLPAFSGETEDDDESQKRLEDFERFFDKDLLVKKTMIDMAPTESDDFDEHSRIAYSDRLLDGLDTIDDTFETFSASSPKSYLEQIKNMKQSLIESGVDMAKLSKFYRTNISDMSPDFVEKVNYGVAGYSIFNYDGKDAKTINEMLHFIHTRKINNEKLLQNLPILKTCEIEGNAFDKINLRGRENAVAEQIFETLQTQSILGETDIVSLKNRIIMMVRDLGHALVMEINKEDNSDDFVVNYHIPKICNAQKVNLLPGVKKVPENSSIASSTSGIFQTSTDSIANDIKNFINMVPTDADIKLER